MNVGAIVGLAPDLTAYTTLLGAVVEHYNQFLKLKLTDAEKRDLIEYLKSL